MTITSTVVDAYATCAEITRTEARNFHYGIRLLPCDKRNALSALYALARRIDDIGDGDLPLDEKRTALHQLRKDLGRLDDVDEPVCVAVADAARRFPVPLGAFEELVEGVETDLAEVRITDFDELVVYCRRVAGSVGRLCLSIFGPTTTSADFDALSTYADQLGIALQQTNILRDIREDLGNDRIYLPADELERFGIQLTFDEQGNLEDPQGRLAGYIRFAAGRAEDWYSMGRRLLPSLDWRSGSSCRSMAGIYHRLLTRIAADPVLVYDRRLSLSTSEKLRVALGSLAGARW